MKHSTEFEAASEMVRSASGYNITTLSESQKAALATTLSDEERRVILHQGTERPFCGHLLHKEEDGIYTCRLCALPLFHSRTKFESGSGWPSFNEPFDPDHIRSLRDDSHGMTRAEVRCRRCDAHLGHVFNDGPPPKGERYCLNSVSLDFVANGAELPRDEEEKNA